MLSYGGGEWYGQESLGGLGNCGLMLSRDVNSEVEPKGLAMFTFTSSPCSCFFTTYLLMFYSSLDTSSLSPLCALVDAVLVLHMQV